MRHVGGQETSKIGIQKGPRKIDQREIWVRPADRHVYIRATLRHFDNEHAGEPKTGPLIPCERRLSRMEIPEFQEVTFGRQI